MAITALAVAIVFWGLTPVAIRYLVAYLTPPHLLVLRFSLSALLLVPLLRGLRRAPWSCDEVLRLIGCAIVGVAGYNIPVTYGAQWVPAGIVGLLIATEPMWIVLIMVLLGERPRWTLVLGLVVAGAGVAMLLGREGMRPTAGGPFLLGAVLVLAGAMMWAVYCVLIPPLSRRHGALLSTALVQIMGVIPLYAFWDTRLFGRARDLHATAWGAVVFLAVCGTAISVILWNYGVGRLGSTQAGVFLYLIPLISVLGGAFLLDEPFTVRDAVSGLMIITGVVGSQVGMTRGPTGTAHGEETVA